MKATRLPVEGLTFDEATHKYEYQGREVPSVTTLIGEWVTVKPQGKSYKVNTFNGLTLPTSVMEGAADTGTAIHHGCEILALGKELNWGKLSKDLIKPLENFRDWMEDFDFEPILVEQPVYNHVLDYAGILDIYGNLMGQPYLVDIKTGPPSWTVGMQTAAYLEPLIPMLLANKLIKPEQVKSIKRGVLYLPKKGGKCKLKALNEPINREDFLNFARIRHLREYQKQYKG
jgi:hypothetical protein